MNSNEPDKLRFRKLEWDDVRQLFEIYSDKEAMKYRGSKPMETLEDAKAFIDNQKLVEKGVSTIRKGVELAATKELIGSVMYRFIENRKMECEIGYSIGRQYWGQGYGRAIVKKVVDIMKMQQDFHKLIAWTRKENIASIKILEKNGFQRVEEDKYPESYLYKKTIM